MFGIPIQEPEPEPEHFEVLADNWPAVVMWGRIGTQWRVSMNGPIGLDYSVLAWLFTLYPTDHPRLLLEDLQVMESAALAAMNKEV